MPTQTSPQFLSKLPPGYSVGRGPDGVQYIVPNYLVPATDLALRSQQQKSILNVHLAAGGVRCFPFLFCNPDFLVPSVMHDAVVAGQYELPDSISRMPLLLPILKRSHSHS